VTQVPKPARLPPLLLVVLILGQGVLLAAPVGTASAATCTVRLQSIVVSPMYVQPGQSVTVRVTTQDTNPAPPPPLLGPETVSVSIRVEDANNRELLNFNGQPTPVDGTVSRAFTIPADVATGTAKVEVSLGASECQLPADMVGPHRWGFHIGVTPDLEVDPATVEYVEHRDTELGPNIHAASFLDAFRFTRYATTTPPNQTCFEENANLPSKFHIKFRVKNAGTGSFSVNQTTGVLPLTIRLLEKNQVLLTKAYDLVVPVGGTSEPILVAETNLTLLEKAGLLDLRIELDPSGVYPDLNRTNNAYRTPQDRTDPKAFFVKAPDLVGGLKDVKLTTDGKVEGSFNMSNVGEAFAGTPPANFGNAQNLCHSRNGGPVSARVYLDVLDEAHLLRVENTSLDVGRSTADLFFESKEKIGAGTHQVILVVDRMANGTSNVRELDETNNTVIANVTVADLLTPTLSNVTVATNATARRVGSPLNITGNVTDDANFTLPGNNIILDMTFPNGTQQSFFVPKGVNTGGGFLANNPLNKDDVHWWFNSTYDQEGEYSFRVRANDTVHQAISPALNAEPLKFTLTSFSKTMELVGISLCRESAPNQTDEPNCATELGSSNSTQPVNRTYDANNTVVRIRFKVPAGATGLENELNNSKAKSVSIRDPDGAVVGNFTPTVLCRNNATGLYFTLCTGAQVGCEGALGLCYDGTYQVEVGNERIVNATLSDPIPPHCQGIESGRNTRFQKPAQWNVTIWVGDAACKFREHGPASLALPVRLRFGLWDTVAAEVKNSTLVGGTSVNALSPAQFRADVTDNIKVNRTFVRITRDGTQVLQEDLAYTGSTPQTGNGSYSRSFPTGIHTVLDRAGEYRWLIGAQDANRTITWQSANGTSCTPDYVPQSCTPTQRTFTLVDTRAPTVANEGAVLVTEAGVDTQPKDAFQAGETLTLEADVDDDTRLNVTVEVQQVGASVVVHGPAPMVRVQGTKYRLGANLTTGPGTALPEGEYQVVVRAVDSANKQATSLQPFRFRVASNLPPTFSLRTPVDGGFGAANGNVSVDIRDTLQGVVASSVQLKYGINTPGAAATPVASPRVVELERRTSDNVPLVLRASFQLPATVQHGDTVTVTAEASDGSVPALAGSTMWNFTVDALAPRTTISCTRSHPAACGSEGPQAVRGDTVFTLAAVDLDPQNKARAGVAAIRYSVGSVTSVGPQQEVAGSNATFRLGQLVAQDGYYTLRFRAVDNAGNLETERSLVFALDSAGPSIENPLVTPTSTGWNLTATITDVESSVRSARAFVRAGATAYEERPLTRIADTTFWSGTLPGARRGAQVCYYLEAADHLDNVGNLGSASSPLCFQSENHPPSLNVLSPRDGEGVGASMTVRWQVSDLDGDPVTVSLAYRRSQDVTLTPVALTTEEQGSRTKVIDTSALVAGSYILQVTAADNQAFNNRTVRTINITVGGEGGSDLGRPTLAKGTFAIGEPVRVEVEIGRPARNVEARLLRDGNLVQSQPMEQVPAGGRFYVATFTVTEPGLYTVEVIGEYADGVPFRISAASPIRVEGGFPLVDVAVMGVLAAAVVALGLTGLKRRGWL
jgi:hypothetical protein